MNFQLALTACPWCGSVNVIENVEIYFIVSEVLGSPNFKKASEKSPESNR